MDSNLRKLLLENDYILTVRSNNIMIKRKVISSIGPMLLLTIIGGIMLLAGGFSFSEGIMEFGIPTFLIGLVMFLKPFVAYVIAPYRGLVINLRDRTLLFRSRYSRAYKFSEVDSLELISNQSDADTNAFSESNKEYRYYLNILFLGNAKEELFRLTSDVNIDIEVEKIKNFSANVLL